MSQTQNDRVKSPPKFASSPRGSLGTPDADHQRASKSVQLLLQGWWTWPTDRQTDTHTDHATLGLAIGCYC